MSLTATPQRLWTALTVTTGAWTGTTCASCAQHRTEARDARLAWTAERALHLAAVDREARQRDEIARLEDENASLRAAGETYEPVKAYRAVGGVA